MAVWKYVGYNNSNWLWTNGVDLAYASSPQPSEIEDYPHPHAAIEKGAIYDIYHGDVMAWLDDVGAYRETLQDMRQRCNVW